MQCFILKFKIKSSNGRVSLMYRWGSWYFCSGQYCGLLISSCTTLDYAPITIVLIILFRAILRASNFLLYYSRLCAYHHSDPGSGIILPFNTFWLLVSSLLIICLHWLNKNVRDHITSEVRPGSYSKFLLASVHKRHLSVFCLLYFMLVIYLLAHCWAVQHWKKQKSCQCTVIRYSFLKFGHIAKARMNNTFKHSCFSLVYVMALWIQLSCRY